MLLVPGHNRGYVGAGIWVQYNYTYIRYLLYFSMTAWKHSKRILIVAVVEVFLQEDSFHF